MEFSKLSDPYEGDENKTKRDPQRPRFRYEKDRSSDDQKKYSLKPGHLS